MATDADRGGYQPENPTPLEAEDLAPPALGSWIGNRVETGIPVATIDDIVCRNVPGDPFARATQPTAGRWFRFSVDVFVHTYVPPAEGRGPTFILRPSGAFTLEEIPEAPHARHP